MSAPEIQPTDADVAALLRQLTAHEGFRSKPYKDTVGKLTVGIGRNLDDVGLRRDEAEFMLRRDLEEVEQGLDAKLPWWRTLDAVRQAVLLDMGFNLGVPGLVGFKTTLKLVQTGSYAAAAEQMLRSKWAGQVGRRAQTLSKMMREGRHAF